MWVILWTSFFVLIFFGQYRSWDQDKAVEDYYSRIRDHEKYYETIDDQTWPYIRIFNVRAPSFYQIFVQALLV